MIIYTHTIKQGGNFMKCLKFIKTEKLLFLTATLTFLVTSFSVNTTCAYLVNQPKIPEKAKKLRKF